MVPEGRSVNSFSIAGLISGLINCPPPCSTMEVEYKSPVKILFQLSNSFAAQVPAIYSNHCNFTFINMEIVGPYLAILATD